MAYTKRACHECGFRDIQPNMQQKTVQVTSGRSKSSVSLATFVGVALGDKRSGRAIGNSILNTGQRTYTRNKTIYLCDNCSGAAAARSAKYAKERARQEKKAQREANRQTHAEWRAELKAQQSQLGPKSQANAEPRSEHPQPRKVRLELLTRRLAEGQLDAKTAVLVKRAFRNRFLTFVRTAIEAVVIFIIVIVMTAVTLPKDLAATVAAATVLGSPLYIPVVYLLRARKITSARKVLLDEPDEHQPGLASATAIASDQPVT